MKKLFLAMVLCLMASGLALAESVSFSARTGDVSFDAFLGDMNMSAKADTDDFYVELGAGFGVPTAKIHAMALDVKMQPADIYMALKISEVSGKPLEVVVGEYKKSKGKGWGVISQGLGIKPGSKEFHALKAEKRTFTKKKGKKEKGDDDEEKGHGKGHGKK